MTQIDLNKLKQKLEKLAGDDYDFEVADYLLTIKFDGKLLNDLQKQVVSTNILDNEVFNGGFDQFYLNQSDKYIDDAIEGLRKFGTQEFYELAVKSKEIFQRDKELYKDKRNPQFDPLDDRFYALHHYGQSRIDFVKANIDKIIV